MTDPVSIFAGLAERMKALYSPNNPGQPAVDIFASLGERIKALQTTNNPAEATALLSWVDKKGLETLKPNLEVFLQQPSDNPAESAALLGWIQSSGLELLKPSLELFLQGQATPLPSPKKPSPKKPAVKPVAKPTPKKEAPKKPVAKPAPKKEAPKKEVKRPPSPKAVVKPAEVKRAPSPKPAELKEGPVLFAVVGPAKSDIDADYVLAVGTDPIALQAALPLEVRQGMAGLSRGLGQSYYVNPYGFEWESNQRQMGREVEITPEIKAVREKYAKLEPFYIADKAAAMQAYRSNFKLVAYRPPVQSGPVVFGKYSEQKGETRTPLGEMPFTTTDAKTLMAFKDRFGKGKSSDNMYLLVLDRRREETWLGSDRKEYIFGTDPEQLFTYLVERVALKIRFIKDAAIYQVGPAMWIDYYRNGSIGGGMTEVTFEGPTLPAQSLYSFQSLFEALPELKYVTPIPEDLKGCLDTRGFKEKYEIKGMFQDVDDVLYIRVIRKVDGKPFTMYAQCLQPGVPHSYTMANLLAKYGDQLPNVAQLQDCAVIERDELKALWKGEGLRATTIGEGRWKSQWANIPKCEETFYFLTIFDDIETTLYELGSSRGQRRHEEKGGFGFYDIQPYHIFEWFYTYTQLYGLGIDPSGLYSTNIGFVRTDTPVRYKICDCVVEFPAGMHIKLFGFQRFREVEEEEEKLSLTGEVEEEEEKKLSVTDVQTYMIGQAMKKATIVEGNKINEQLPDNTYLVFEALTKINVPAIALLYSMAKNLFKCVPGEMKASISDEKCSEYDLSKLSYLWEPPAPLQNFRLLTADQATRLKTLWKASELEPTTRKKPSKRDPNRMITVSTLAEDYPGLNIFAFDYLRSVLPQDQLNTALASAEDLDALVKRLVEVYTTMPLHLRLFYQTSDDNFWYSVDKLIDLATQYAEPEKKLMERLSLMGDHPSEMDWYRMRFNPYE